MRRRYGRAAGGGMLLAVAGALLLPPAAVAEEADPALVGRPPQTARVEHTRVLAMPARVHELAPRVHPLIVRTGSIDGALGRDEGAGHERYTLSGDVFFEDDAADLTDRARSDLADIAEELAQAGAVTVLVVGHTDTVGTDAHNEELSLARAEEVEAFLTDEVGSLDVTTEGRGPRELLAPEEGTDAEIDHARALNRRVEITADYDDGTGPD